ncbi:MAG TPA: response regulator transcription factor [Pyrinomonadaceae bacterium]|nr:response regulator transcription factor [Pyrinomonadaceae bacterium]
MNRVRVLIAEDHDTVREGLRLILTAQSDIDVVGEAGDGRSAIEQAKKLEPDVVLMDVSMPQLNGLKATKELTACCPNIKVLTLTRHKDDGYLQQLLRAGAAGYVLKQSPSTELLHAIRAVAAGGRYLDPAIAGKVVGSYIAKKNNKGVSPLSEPSERESEVLRLIAWGYSNKEIATQLALSVKTVEVHKANGMRKLGMGSRIDLVRYAILQGWMQET